MTSWAVVCDVYFLEPQKKGNDESAQQFAERVQRLIAERAKLQIAPWDGYLKYYTLGIKVTGPSHTLAFFSCAKEVYRRHHRLGSGVVLCCPVIHPFCIAQRMTCEHAPCLC